jgi:hypothetical protein
MPNAAQFGSHLMAKSVVKFRPTSLPSSLATSLAKNNQRPPSGGLSQPLKWSLTGQTQAKDWSKTDQRLAKDWPKLPENAGKSAKTHHAKGGD